MSILVTSQRLDLNNTKLTIEQQAAAYRFLRECSPISSSHAAIIVQCPEYRNGRLIDGDRCLWGDDLDDYISAMVACHSAHTHDKAPPASTGHLDQRTEGTHES